MSIFKNKLLRLIAIAMFFLTACSETDSSEQKLYSIPKKERIEKIEAKYEEGFLRKGAYLVVTTEVQTYVMFPSRLLNNFSTENRLISINKLSTYHGSMRSTALYLELTPESYKFLSEQFTEVTGLTLSHKNITLEEELQTN